MDSLINPEIYAVDFDGTLCENAYPEIGEPKQVIIDKVIDSQKKGKFIILWTCREMETLDAAVKWCGERGLVFDAINDQAPWIKEAFKCVGELKQIVEREEGRCGVKIFANKYIDDRAVNVDDFLGDD